jgi:phosphate-selective porin OprO/OprP
VAWRRAAGILIPITALLVPVAAAQEPLPPERVTAEAPSTRPWNELEASWISVRLGFAAMEDGAFYVQDAASREQVGTLSSEALFRLDDLSLSGQLRFARPWSFRFAGNYNGLDPTSSRGWSLTYAYLGIPLGDAVTVTLGKQKQGVGLEMLENGRDLPFMERSVLTTAMTFASSHVVGIRLSGGAAAGRMTWSGGWFNNWLDDGLSFRASGNVVAGRVTGLVLEESASGPLLHLGASAAWRQSQNGNLRSKSIPEVYEAPDFVDTGDFPATSATTLAGELAAVRGPVTVSAEYALTPVSSPQTNDPRFTGWYVMASWCLTGERRPYDRATGTFGAIVPASPFSFRHGGRGAWEVAARYSGVDLTSGTVQGGRFERLSGALSWRPTGQWRLEFDYGYGTLARQGLTGHASFFQLRLQFQL